MERILVTGANGLVGSYFCRLLSEYDVFLVSHSGIPSERMPVADLSEREPFCKALEAVRPDIVVHLAAITDVDRCEVDREGADRTNHLPLADLSRYLEKNKSCFLLYVSTDYIFDGITGSYGEADRAKPVNWYGVTKLYGESELVRSGSKNWCIARTSTPFGVHEKKESFPLFVIKNLSSGKEITAVTNQVTSPTYAGNLAGMMFEIVKKRIGGVIHTAGSSRISRYDQAMVVAHAFGLDQRLIKPAEIKDMKWRAPRPANSSLDVSKAATILDNRPIEYQDGLRRMAAEMKLAWE